MQLLSNPIIHAGRIIAKESLHCKGTCGQMVVVDSQKIITERLPHTDDGEVVNSMRQLVQETLSPTTQVPWDLSDLKGITVVDDPQGEHAPPTPVSISAAELAARTQSAYGLKTVPAGFTMEITSIPAEGSQGPVLYTVSCLNPDGDSIMISGGGMMKVALPQNANETDLTREVPLAHARGLAEKNNPQ